jgi:hypothetical protein
MRTKASDIRSIVRRVMMMVVWGSKGQRRASYVIPVIWASSAMSKARAHELSLSYPSIPSIEGISYFCHDHLPVATCIPSNVCLSHMPAISAGTTSKRSSTSCNMSRSYGSCEGTHRKEIHKKHKALTPQQRRTGILMAISRSVPITQSKSQSKKQTSVPCFADNSMLVS